MIPTQEELELVARHYGEMCKNSVGSFGAAERGFRTGASFMQEKYLVLIAELNERIRLLEVYEQAHKESLK